MTEPPSANAQRFADELDRRINERAERLALAVGFIARFRRNHGFVTPRVEELAPIWARAISAAAFWVELAKDSAGAARLVEMIRARLASIEAETHAEGRKGLPT